MLSTLSLCASQSSIIPRPISGHSSLRLAYTSEIRICAGRKAALGVTVVGVKSRKERLCNAVRRAGAERRRFARKAEGIASEALILFLLGAGGSAKAETSRVIRSISHFRL